jgi:hypothetical protein
MIGKIAAEPESELEVFRTDSPVDSPNKAQLCLSPDSELPSLANECVYYRNGAKIDAMWTKWRFTEVCWLMLNGNDPHFFLQVWQDAQGKAHFAKNKTARANARAEWAWNSITGKSKQPVGIGFYPTNVQGQSRWGAMDFDCHGDDTEQAEKARQRAFAAFHLLSRHTKHLLLLGTSGSLGWHLFVYADRFYPVEEWIRFLQEVARKIGVPVVDGTCEIFPSTTRGRIGGKGIRAPGTINPKTGQCGRIYLDQITPALALIESSSSESKNQSKTEVCSEEKSLSLFCISVLRRRKSVRTQIKDTQDTDKRQSDPISELEAQYHIKAADTRRSQLKRLIGESFRCYGREVLRQAADRQYKLAAITPEDSLTEHMTEFDELFTFFHDLWLQELSQAVREKLSKLKTQNEIDFVRIVHGWHKLKGDAPDFALSTGNMALKLGMGVSGVAKMRKKIWKEEGIINQTVPFAPNKTSARFEWTADLNAYQQNGRNEANQSMYSGIEPNET